MVRVIIDGVECEIDHTKPIALGRRGDEIVDFESGRTGTTVEFRLPLKGVNCEIFGACGDVHASEKFNSEWHEAVIESDGIELFSGTAYLMQIIWSGGERFAVVECRGGVIWWVSRAATTLLKSVDIDFETTLNESNFKSGWEDDSPVKFFPIVRDRYEAEGSSVDVTGVRKLRSIDDYHPFIQVEALITALLTQSGYTVESTTSYDENFSQLYLSGNYGSAENSAAQEAMGFFVKRGEDTITVADSLGRVSMSPYDAYSSVGNIVSLDTVAADYECYNHGNVMQIEDEALCFVPLTTISAGFEYFLHYTCLCSIESRTRLKGIDRLNTVSNGCVKWEITNRYIDQRERFQTGILYKMIIFDFEQGRSYQLVAEDSSGEEVVLSIVDERMSSIIFDETYVNLRIERCSSDEGGEPITYGGDWALYYGYVTERVATEVKVTIRTSPQSYSPTSPMQFELQMFEGADSGASFTLHGDTTLRPYFSEYPGYNSTVTFADVAQHSFSALDFMGAMQHLFNLRISTNEQAKVVTIESFDNFYFIDQWDWSDRLVEGAEIGFEDLAHTKSRSNTLGYQQSDGVVKRLGQSDNAIFGEWSYQIDSYAASGGSKTLLNPIFSASTSDEDGVMVVGDRDDIELVNSLGFSPRIARYFDMRAVEGENYSLPYVAFHAPEEEFTLCFENRDGVAGLNRHYTTEVALARRSQLISLTLKLSALDYSNLFSPCEGAPSLRSIFTFTLCGESFRTILHSVESYELHSGVARCLFLSVD